jgi:hypothetical protein
MDYLIKMELARANLQRAQLELTGVDGLEYLVERIGFALVELTGEIAAYKEHTLGSEL